MRQRTGLVRLSYQVCLAVRIVLCQFGGHSGRLFTDELVRRAETDLQDFEASQLVKVVGLQQKDNSLVTVCFNKFKTTIPSCVQIVLKLVETMQTKENLDKNGHGINSVICNL